MDTELLELIAFVVVIAVVVLITYRTLRHRSDRRRKNDS